MHGRLVKITMDFVLVNHLGGVATIYGQHLIGMGRYRYQIFDTIDTGLRSDGIDTRKQYRSVSIHARAALCMRKVYVSTLSRENQ